MIKRLNNELKESKPKELHKNININKKGVRGKSKNHLFENNLFGKKRIIIKCVKMKKKKKSKRQRRNSKRQRRSDMESKKNKRSITVLGDSIGKDVKPIKMKRMMEKNDRLYVKCFPGANVSYWYKFAKYGRRSE